MFRASLLPSQSLYGSWTSIQDIRSWAAIEDSVWVQFAKCLGDESLDNVSMLASMLPSDIKEATEATQTNPIARTKLRLIYAVARVMYEVDPVGAPPVAASVAVEPRSKMARTDTGLSLKIKVSSILDQSSDREVIRWSREELNFLRSRYRSLEGEDPMKSEEVTDDQMSVLCELTKVGIAPFADFGVWKPFGQRHAKTLKFTSHFLDHTGAWRCKEIPGPDCFATWEACWRVFRKAAIMCDIAAPAVLDRYASRFKKRVDRFSDAWHLCVLADTRCRSELCESEYRRQSQFHESNPEISAFVPSRPWNSVIRATSNDRDFWKEELEDKVADFRNVRQIVNKFGSKDRSRSRRRGGTKQDRGRTGGAHPHRGSDGRYSTTATGSQICFAWNRAQDGCAVKCGTNRAHVCEFCLEPHRAIECTQNPGWKPPAKDAGNPAKGAGKGKHEGKQ